ncbi:5-formyltetrahydrofolate cyclo-ligase [Alkalicoccus chagannorensis]|uniref:5-formyltetrahydrofolate cyclo-ligase n=1 Tax=Alkalicoccus chagannorensis TaxID=427072 RepID=UPI00041269E5|nr:5-formyltetrahydrofolate cyclo-ligase [Alkalicoccus chagannorensis]
MDKKGLRKTILAELDQMEESVKLREESIVLETLLQMDTWKQAQHPALTIAVGGEFPTEPLFEAAWEEGKIPSAPVVIQETKEMAFYEVKSWDDCRPAAFGLVEPDPEKCRRIRSEDLDFILVPGVAFDRRHYRIGYGGGYYDRFLAVSSAPSCAVFYSCQLIDEVPDEAHDQRVDYMIGVPLL